MRSGAEERVVLLKIYCRLILEAYEKFRFLGFTHRSSASGGLVWVNEAKFLWVSKAMFFGGVFLLL